MNVLTSLHFNSTFTKNIVCKEVM